MTGEIGDLFAPEVSAPAPVEPPEERPRQYAARILEGAATLDEVPAHLRQWVQHYIDLGNARP